jgi:integrase/recombinase XerD
MSLIHSAIPPPVFSLPFPLAPIRFFWLLVCYSAHPPVVIHFHNRRCSMTALRQRMIEDMQLRGLAPLTQRAYLQAIEQFARYCGKSPDQITDEELRQYFLYLSNHKQVARSTATVALCAIKFLFEHTLRQPWPTLDLIRPRLVHTLPIVLSVDEVWRILSQLRLPSYRTCLATIYTCGLRLHEGVSLQVKQIDSARMQLHIRGGKGNKDRYVPLPPRTLTFLRTQWLTHRNPVWLFPTTAHAGYDPHTARVPLSDRAVRKAFHAALQSSGVTKAACVHTLRHSWATHLLEAGVNVRLIQVWLGHRSPTTTAIYTHLTRKVEQQASEALEQLTAAMPW